LAEERHGPLELLTGAVDVALEGEPFSERPGRASPVEVMRISEQLECFAGPVHRFVSVLEQGCTLRLLGSESCQVDRLRIRAKEALSALEVCPTAVGVALRAHDPGGQQVGS